MVDALWMDSGKASTAIGTATIATDGTFTLSSHGLSDGETVTVDTLTGGAAAAFNADAVYFVRDVAGNDFALSLTLHGPVVTLGSTGGAAVYRWAPGYNALELRRSDAVLLYPGSADEFAAHSGVRPHSQNPISIAGTTWKAHDLTAIVTASAGSGPYRVALAETTGEIDPADATFPRIDVLDLQIQDDTHDASGQRRARVFYTAGSAAASPIEPGALSNAVRLGAFDVPASGGGAATVRYQGALTVAAGGVLPDRDGTEAPSAGRYHGMVRYRQDTDTLQVWDGTAWTTIGQLGGWETIHQSTITTSTDIPITDRYPAGTFDRIKVTLRGSLSALERLTLRVNNDSTAGLHRRGLIVLDSADGSVVTGTDATVADDGTVWYLAQWSTGDSNACEAVIYGTDQNTSLTMQSVGYRAATSTALRHKSFGSGDLSATRLLSSVRIGAGGSETPGTIDVTIEGHRPL